MKLIILQEKLKEGLAVVGKVSAKSLTLPILKNVLIKSEKNFLSLTTTDLEMGITWWGLAKIEEAGETTVATDIFSGFLGLLPNKQVDLAISGQFLTIGCENYKIKIKSNSVEEFPIIPQITQNEFVVVNNKSFCYGLSQVVDISASSNARPEISGVFLSFARNIIRIAATDSFRLAEKVVTLEKEKENEKLFSFIIPQKTAREIVNVFGDKNGELKIYPGANQVLFELMMSETAHPYIHLSSRLIEGEYPNYQEIIPKEYETQITVGKDEFVNKIKAASLFSGRINEVCFKVDPKKEQVEITSQNPEAGDFNAVINAKIKGKETEISFDCRYLIDGLANIKSSEIFFGLSGGAKDEVGPGVIKPIGDANYVYVVMPIKTA